MSFPYEKFESFVSSIQNRKSFLIPDVNVTMKTYCKMPSTALFLHAYQ